MDRVETHVKAFGVVAAYDEEVGIFLVSPNRLGFGVVCAPLSGGDDALGNKLNLLNSMAWPEGTLMQFTNYCSPDLIDVVLQYKELRRHVQDPLLKAMSDGHVQWMVDSTNKPVDQASGIRLRSNQLMITVQIPWAGAKPSEKDIREVKDLQIGFMQAIKSAGLSYAKLSAESYIRFMETVLNQAPDAAWKRSPLTAYDQREVICSQLLDPGSAVEFDKDGLWLNGNTRVKVLSPKKYPSPTHFGIAMRYLTDWRQGARGIRENAIITLNVYFQNNDRERAKLEKERIWNQHQSGTQVGRFVSFFRDKLESVTAILNEVKEGDRVVNAYISMAILNQGDGTDEASRARTEEASQAAVMNAMSYWREFGFTMMQDRYFVLPLFCNMLPFAGDADLKEVLQRYRKMAGLQAIHLAPVMGSWRGTGTPVVTLTSRDGQVQPISPWDTDGNMNFLIAAQSGMGKSVFSNNMIANLRTMDAAVYVIDVGDSYKNLCESLEGQYLEFGKGSAICLNPFSLVKDYREEEDMLAEMIIIMAAPNEGLSDKQRPQLKRVMSRVFDQFGSQTNIDLIAEALQLEDDSDVKVIGQMLYPFTSAGSYGSFFNGQNTLQVGGKFTVLELGALKAKMHLQRVVLLSLMYQIGQAVYLGDRKMKQMLLIDEAWQLLATDDAATFIERAYRQFRKHNASVGIVTQSVMDVWQTKGGRAIAENSAHMYLLGQKADAIEGVRKEGKMPFGEWGYDMLKTVHTVPGVYSEIMCVTPYGVGIGRLVLNDFQKIMFSTKGEDVAAVKAHRDRGMNLGDAINAVLRDRGMKQKRVA